MFIVRKIFGAGSNVPEPIAMPAATGTAYKVGCALKIENGALTHAAATDKPTFIAAETLEKNEKSTVLCYPIFPNMLFEVPMLGNPSTVKVGAKLTLVDNEQGFIDAVGTDTNGGNATLIDMNGASASGDCVYVRFD